MTGLMNKKIVSYMNELFPNPRCELNYQKDYELLIAVMLSAQTTDKRVNMVTDILFKKFDTIEKLSRASEAEIIEIIRPIGTFNKKAKNIINISKLLLTEKQGKVPNDRQYLESLPGVGRKTANVVLSNLFGVPCIAVDTHVSRVSKRLGISDIDDSPYVVEKKLNNIFCLSDLSKLHHQFVLFGRYNCTARKPKCDNCKLKDICTYINKK